VPLRLGKRKGICVWAGLLCSGSKLAHGQLERA